MNFVKKTKRTTAGHRLAREVLEAPRQVELAMYLNFLIKIIIIIIIINFLIKILG